MAAAVAVTSARVGGDCARVREARRHFVRGRQVRGQEAQALHLDGRARQSRAVSRRDTFETWALWVLKTWSSRCRIYMPESVGEALARRENPPSNARIGRAYATFVSAREPFATAARVRILFELESREGPDASNNGAGQGLAHRGAQGSPGTRAARGRDSRTTEPIENSVAF